MLRIRGGIPRRRLHKAISDIVNEFKLLNASDTDIGKEFNDGISLKGWIRSIRRHKSKTFLDIYDGSLKLPKKDTIQVVFKTEIIPKDLRAGSSVEVFGSLRKCLESFGHGYLKQQNAVQDFEVICDGEWIKVFGNCDAQTFPLQLANHQSSMSVESLRLIPHLRTRNPFFAKVLKAKSEFMGESRSFLKSIGCWEIHPPCITRSSCEPSTESVDPSTNNSTSSSIKVSWDHQNIKNVFLTVSNQLHLEAAACGGLGRVFSLSPVWRNEKHNTPRHLAEFYMLEVEISFISSIHDLMDVCEQLLSAACLSLVPWLTTEAEHKRLEQFILPKQSTSIDSTEAQEQQFHRKLNRMTYSDALRYTDTSPDGKLTPECERMIAEKFGPTFIYHYPSSKRPFYMLSRKFTDGKDYAECFDLILPGKMGEAVGGSLREHRHSYIQKNLSERHLIPPIDSKNDIARDNPYEWYLDLSRWGTTPHGGFGVGVDRILAYIFDLQNIRDMVFIPRDASTANIRC